MLKGELSNCKCVCSVVTGILSIIADFNTIDTEKKRLLGEKKKEKKGPP